MAYFIVLGTSNDLKTVVDEIKKSHLQQNIVTSGCIEQSGGELYYNWDIYNSQGDKRTSDDGREPVILKNALTNQISHFKTLLPNNVVPNVFIVSKCLTDGDFDLLEMLCENLYEIGGAQLLGLQIDIVLLGYDLNSPEDVTIRPYWRKLQHLKHVVANGRFTTNLLYLNNMDYLGAATDVNAKILSKFLCNWSKLVCSSSRPKATVNSLLYAIGMSEYQYDFRDLNDFFKHAAEERRLDRRLNHNPSLYTQDLISQYFYKVLDWSFPWLDGLKKIHSLWSSYCTTKLNISIPITQNTYSLARHEYEIALYLNSFLKLYIQEEKREIARLQAQLEQKEIEKTNSEVVDCDLIDKEIDNIKRDIKNHNDNISKNSFDLSDINQVQELIDYLRTPAAKDIMFEAVNRATTNDTLPSSYPKMAIVKLGHLDNQNGSGESSEDHSKDEDNKSENLDKRRGCIGWIKGIFKRTTESDALEPIALTEAVHEELNASLTTCIEKLREASDIHTWWVSLCSDINSSEARIAECKLFMDGEKDINGLYVKGKEGYKPPYHRKSISIIDMDRVRKFRDNDSYYKTMIDIFLRKWFDKNTSVSERTQLIEQKILNPLYRKFHTLKWNGTNPFVNEDISDEELHDQLEHSLSQSVPFVEYVKIKTTTIDATLNTSFVSNNQNIAADPVVFRDRYNLSDDTIVPIYLKDFVNSMCVVKVLDIPDHIDSLEDFRPKREFKLEKFPSINDCPIGEIIGLADTIEDKARAIYDWICENIAYDTTYQISTAESCWKMKRGVCAAYCELYSHLASLVGITAEIVVGKTKNTSGDISKEEHSWIYVYTKGYDGFFVDPTWGAGYLRDGKLVKNEDHSTWFKISPYWMIFSHFPNDHYWTNLDLEITDDQFVKLPYYPPSIENDGRETLFEHIFK